MADRDMERRILRERQAGLARDLDRLGPAPQGAASELVQVYQQTTIPTTNGKYFACHPVVPGGAEVEGGAAGFTADTSLTLFVLVIGSRVPAAGDYLIARAIGGRWLAEGRSGLCTTTFVISRPNSCPASAAVEFRDVELGGVLVFSGTALAGSTSSSISYTNSIPGHHYDISWSFGGLSGTETGVPACSTRSITIANPTGYMPNCPVAMPTLYVTDSCGTHQIWPTPDCFSCTTGFTYDWTVSLSPAGTCGSPSWSTVYQNFFSGHGCNPAFFAGGFDGNSGLFSLICTTRPIFVSGTYPACGFGGHPLCGQAFNIHE